MARPAYRRRGPAGAIPARPPHRGLPPDGLRCAAHKPIFSFPSRKTAADQGHCRKTARRRVAPHPLPRVPLRPVAGTRLSKSLARTGKRRPPCHPRWGSTTVRGPLRPPADRCGGARKVIGHTPPRQQHFSDFFSSPLAPNPQAIHHQRFVTEKNFRLGFRMAAAAAPRSAHAAGRKRTARVFPLAFRRHDAILALSSAKPS